MQLYVIDNKRKIHDRIFNTRKQTWKEAKARKSIDSRPLIVAEKSEIGHWEGDTIEGKGHKERNRNGIIISNDF